MITAIEPKVSPTGRYNVTETCKALGICRNSLYKYTREGLIKCIFSRVSIRRKYLGQEILRFWKATM